MKSTRPRGHCRRGKGKGGGNPLHPSPCGSNLYTDETFAYVSHTDAELCTGTHLCVHSISVEAKGQITDTIAIDNGERSAPWARLGHLKGSDIIIINRVAQTLGEDARQ